MIIFPDIYTYNWKCTSKYCHEDGVDLRGFHWQGDALNQPNSRSAGVGHIQPTPPGPSPFGTLRERTTGAPGAPGGGLEPWEGDEHQCGSVWKWGVSGKLWIQIPNGCFHTRTDDQPVDGMGYPIFRETLGYDSSICQRLVNLADRKTITFYHILISSKDDAPMIRKSQDERNVIYR